MLPDRSVLSPEVAEHALQCFSQPERCGLDLVLSVTGTGTRANLHIAEVKEEPGSLGRVRTGAGDRTMYFEHSAEGKYCALDYGESHKSGELELAGHARPGRFGCAFFRLPLRPLLPKESPTPPDISQNVF